jgi:hypothetical protein
VSFLDAGALYLATGLASSIVAFHGLKVRYPVAARVAVTLLWPFALWAFIIGPRRPSR